MSRRQNPEHASRRRLTAFPQGYRRGAVSRRALRGLGINVSAPVEQYRAAYERFLPIAVKGGIFPLLLTEPEAPSLDPEGELRWLAAHLVVNAPATDDQWWSRLWSAAAERLPQGCTPPAELDLPAREALLRQLLDEGGASDLVRALTAAMREQSGC